MTISKRERTLIVAATVALLLFAIIFVLPRLGGTEAMAAADTTTLAGMRAAAETRLQQDRRLESLAQDLGVKLPTVDPDQQVEEIVKSVEKLIGANSLKVTAFNPRSRSARSTAKRQPGSEIEFDLRFGADHRGLFGFLAGMRTEGLPVRVKSLQLQTQANPQKMDVTMRLAFVLLEPMPEPKKSDESTEPASEKEAGT
ncbi:MAG: hypothetical protein PWP23_1604 [Candidatus Sumerlaeota bacterium]|nr:hypothetical protein [Candidatus Sumerlaeota bacterium]